MNTGWVILLIVLALLYGFVIIGHSAAKHLRKKTQDEVPDEPPATGKVRKPYISDEQMRELMEAALRRIKESEKRAEEARAALDEQLAKEKRKNEEIASKQALVFDDLFEWRDMEGVWFLFYKKETADNYHVDLHSERVMNVKKGYICARFNFNIAVSSPVDGVLSWLPEQWNGFLRMERNMALIKVDPTPSGQKTMEDYIAEKERLREQMKKNAEKREREEIAAKIKERERRRQLEKEVRQKLIDSGELFGDEQKRPPISREVVDAVYRRDGGRCVYCGSTEDLQIDHIIPFSKGGSSELANLQLLCRKCNIEKSNKIG